MAENFVVNYDINVFDNGSKAINAFVSATNKLTEVQRNFNKLNNQLNSMQQKLVAFSSQKAYKISINTQPAIQNVDKLMRRLKQLENYAKGMGVTVGQVVGTGGVQTGKATRVSRPVQTGATSFRRATRSMESLKNNVLGKTLIDSGGVGVFDLVKGMGVAYGITGLGSLVSNVIKDSSAYDNLIQTTKNILSTHDTGMDFVQRFKSMENIIRGVGVQTKFTAPQVADASKFLAMAGFNVDEIKQSIKPIADIALIGDTDLGQTADVVTNIMTGYGIGADRVRHASDVMTQTFTMTNTTLLEMAEAYKYAGSLLARNGTSFEESAAAIGVLGDAGIKGSQAGTTLRTIAANFAKPTNNQAEAWNRIGVKTTDAYGNVRPMVEIFQDLASKNLALSDYYSIFHKTAASGAAALAANVEKWNEVISQNFMSAGLSQKLADEKKNTFQGLWAQLTSAFTEAGMQAFEDIQSPIRNILNQTIEWLKSKEAIDAIKRAALSIKSLIDELVRLSKWLYNIYKRFEGIITLWLKFQMYASVAMIPMKVISSLKDFLKYITLSTQGVGTFVKSFAQFKDMWSIVDFFRGNFWGANMQNAIDTPHEVRSRYIRLAKYNALKSLLPGFATFGLAGLGAWGGSYLGEQSGVGSTLGSLGGGAAGMLLGGYASKWIPGILAAASSILSGPIGWIGMAATAIGAATLAYVKYRKSISKANEATQQFIDSTKAVNGISMSEHATMADKYLQIVTNKQMAANEKVAEYIRLRREELGLNTEAASKEDSTPLKKLDKYREQYNAYKKADPSKYLQALSVFRTQNMDIANGDVTDVYRILRDGIVTDIPANNISSYKKWLAAVSFTRAMGADLSAGTEAQKLRDKYIQAYLYAGSLDEWNETTKAFNAEVENLRKSIIPGSERWGATITDHNEYEFLHSFDFIGSEIKSVTEALEESPILKIWKDIITSKNTITEAQKAQLLYAMGVAGFNPELGVFGSEDYMKKWGWYGGLWHAAPGMSEFSTSGPASQENFQLQRQHALDAIDRLAAPYRPMFNGILGNPVWNAGKAGNSSHVATVTSGSTDDIDDGTDALSANTFVPGGNGGYTNQYRSASAAPKQIILTIGNLMNLEHVDLTNPTNVAVVEDLKGQLAQTLMDVVSDFSINMGNMA